MRSLRGWKGSESCPHLLHLPDKKTEASRKYSSRLPWTEHSEYAYCIPLSKKCPPLLEAASLSPAPAIQGALVEHRLHTGPFQAHYPTYLPKARKAGIIIILFFFLGQEAEAQTD